MALTLSSLQQRIVDHQEGAILVVAGPGSGKTRVLTERVRRLLSEDGGHFRVLALTFTNKAANEMKERLQDVPQIMERAFIGTLHSFCVEVLANRGKPVGIENLPAIFESAADRKQVLHEAAMSDPELRLHLQQAHTNKDQSRLISDWLDSIREAKSNLLTPDLIDDPVIQRAYEAYDAGLRSSGAVDFDDLLLLTHRLFQDRPKIADFYRRQYRYICIDEAQDLNEAQYAVLKALCGTEYNNVMMVGDPKQAIFVWNGAHPKYLDLFERDFGAVRISMNDNYRSAAEVVSVARALAPDYEVEGRLPVQGLAKALSAVTEVEEAQVVIEVLRHLVDKGHPDVEGPITLSRCAILGRTRYALVSIEKELHRLQWPFYKQLSNRHESESDLVMDFELCLRILANPRDRLHPRALLMRWKGDPSLQELLSSDSALPFFRSLSERTNNSHQLAVLGAVIGLSAFGPHLPLSRALDTLEQFAMTLSSVDERALVLEDLRAWRQHWDFYVRQQPGGLHSAAMFLGQVALGTTQQPRQDGIALLTVHSAKGMEFDVVFVMGMVEGVFPDYRATGASLEEERRNAFVAVTRSRRLLYLTYPKTRRMPWGDIKTQTPSRFLRIPHLI